MSEELALQKRFGERGTVEGDEGPFCAWAERVNRSRELPLTGPALVARDPATWRATR